MTRLLTPANACLLLAAVSAGTLLTAFALQYLGGVAPCQLCIWQRWPYVLLVALGLVGWRWQPRVVLVLATAVLVGGAGLAAYHVGIEEGWWALPESCVAGGGAASVDDLRQLLAEAPPACDQVGFTLLGLTLAGWNLVTSLGLAVLTLAAAIGLGRRQAQNRLAPAGR